MTTSKTVELKNTTFPEVVNEFGKWDKEKKEHISCVVKAPIFERDGQVLCALDTGDGYLFADYDGEYRTDWPWINPILEDWAKENFGKGSYWEWENSGCLSLVKED
jgi:hypothetical protein